MKSPTVQLAKTLAYVLGRRPDEFGLVTDSEGFVKIKDLLKAFGEEKDLPHIRRGQLYEIIATIPDAPFEIGENLIRAKDRTHLVRHHPPEILPKLLYVCVRRKAYPVVLENGIVPTSFTQVVLSSDPDMARRIGSRNDISPVLLTVSVQQARDTGVRFLSAGGTLYLAETVPAGCFTGPPLTKVQEETSSREPKIVPTPSKQPGSFFPDPAAIFSEEGHGPKDRRGSRSDWKRDRKRMQRMERKKGPRF